MRKATGYYPSLTVDTTAKRVVTHAGAVLLVATAPVAVHRRQRQPAHRVRHEHHRRATPGPGTAAPASGRCEDRIRNANDTGLGNLPLHNISQKRILVAVTMLAAELSTWMHMLALARHRCPGLGTQTAAPAVLFSIAGRITRRSRRTRLQLSAHAPYGPLIAAGLGLVRLNQLPQPT